jgi:hypothetical protein
VAVGGDGVEDVVGGLVPRKRPWVVVSSSSRGSGRAKGAGVGRLQRQSGTAREALRSLEGHGLVSVRRGVAGGIFVTVPPADKVEDSLQMGLDLLAERSELSVGALMEVREYLEIPA